MLKHKRLIFFDMGNTLLDFHQGPSDEDKDKEGLFLMQEKMKSYGVEVSLEALTSGFLKGIYNNHRVRMEELLEVDVSPLLEAYGSFTESQCLELLRAFYSPYHRYVYVNDGALDCLQRLKAVGFEIGIISNCYLPGILYEEIFKSTGLDKYVDHYTFSYDVGYRKPRIEIFRIALDKTECVASECIMIGDSYKADMIGAYGAGMDGIWYNPSQTPCRSDYLVHYGEISQFSDLILK